MSSTKTTDRQEPAHPFGAQHPPTGRPTRRLHGRRAFRWTYQIMAVFMAAMTVVTAILGEWPGTVICGLGAPVFWGLSRLFKRSVLAIYGAQLWEHNVLGPWRGPLDLDHLSHVAYIRDRQDPRGGISLLLQAAPSPDDVLAPEATIEERAAWANRHETRISLQDYSRRALERLIAPWVAGKPQIADARLAKLFEQRARHPRTAGVRTLRTRSHRAQ